MTFPVKRFPSQSKGEEVANLMRYDIIAGKLPPKSTISENGIASAYNVSRVPAREALRILQNEGLVNLERMGAVVLGMSRQDMEEITDVRFLIEAFCMNECAKASNESLYSYLRYTLEQMEIAARNNDFIEVSIQDIAFHEAIIEASNHNRFLHIWKGIKNIVITTLLIATEKRMTMEKDKIDSLINKHIELIDSMKTGESFKIEES